MKPVRSVFVLVLALALSAPVLAADFEAGSLEEWRPLAEQGHVIAQSNLGFLYMQGWGVPQDDDEALKWSRKAAEHGDASALNNLGVMYRDGRGVTQDDVQALMWFTIAAAQGQKNRDKITKKIRKIRDRFAKKMTPTYVTNAQMLARECLEKREQ